MKITMYPNKIILDGENGVYFIEDGKTAINIETTQEPSYKMDIKNFKFIGINSKYKIIRKLKKIYYILKE